MYTVSMDAAAPTWGVTRYIGSWGHKVNVTGRGGTMYIGYWGHMVNVTGVTRYMGTRGTRPTARGSQGQGHVVSQGTSGPVEIGREHV